MLECTFLGHQVLISDYDIPNYFHLNSDSQPADTNQALLQATVAMNELSSVATLWCSELNKLDCSLVRDLTEQMLETSRKIAGHLSKMMQVRMVS